MHIYLRVMFLALRLAFSCRVFSLKHTKEEEMAQQNIQKLGTLRWVKCFSLYVCDYIYIYVCIYSSIYRSIKINIKSI